MEVSDGYHTVISAPTNWTVLPELVVSSITLPSPGDEFNTAIDSVEVAFSAPINPATLAVGALSLTLNGGPNLITTAVMVSLVPGTTATYEISGLSALTAGQGTYVLTVNAASVSEGAYGPGGGHGLGPPG